MSFAIRGRIKGDKEVSRAIGRAPEIFVRFLASWLRDERARFVGGKDSKGRKRKGFREILSNRKLAKRSGTWSRRITGLFKGVVPRADKINDLQMRAGVGLRKPNKMHRALWRLQEGGTIRSEKMMPVPVYKNLAKKGITQGFSNAKAFKRLLDRKELVPVRHGRMMLFFDPESRRKRGTGYKRTGLLFIGRHTITVRRSFTGRYDFFGRFNRMAPAMIRRGQGVVDRATKKVERGR